jgi:hypothetical protein
MNVQPGSATEGKLGSNVLREPEINKSTETIKPSKQTTTNKITKNKKTKQ